MPKISRFFGVLKLFFAGKTAVLRAEKTREREIFRELKSLFCFLCKSYVTLMLLLCSSYLKWELYGICIGFT